MRHRNLHLATCLDDARAFGKLVPSAVDLDVDHALLGCKIFGEFDFRGRRSCVAHGW